MSATKLVLVLGLVAACSGGGGPRPVHILEEPRPPGEDLGLPTGGPSMKPPGLRMPGDFTPASYTATLTIDPAQPTFGGTILIEGALVQESWQIWLHAENLTIERAVASTAHGEKVELGAETTRAPGRVVLWPQGKRALPAGPIEISIQYRGQLDAVDTTGTFRQAVGDDWYAFTQHESIYARRSFPCLDEPSSKVPWTLTLVVPSALTAVSNAPAVSDQVSGETRTVRFEKTPPLPTYLVAYAVGPFDIVPAGTSAGGAPIRIIAMKGRAADAAFAASSTPKLLAALEAWFGTPYPYAKLDSIAIPATVGFGAMENPGLITYRESLILMPADASPQRRRRYAGVATHELAHQWFGDLVTPAWWDDIWLNESFATWLPEKIVGAVYPEWNKPTEQVEARSFALDADSLVTARRIRQPIETEDDILTSFDGITYGKGAAVLRMFEHRVGADAFQRGVRAYLAAHAHRTATAADFLGAIAAEAPDADVVAGFGTFLDQAGAPRISAAIECDGTPRVRLAQRRHVPLGAATPTTTPLWRVPVCVKAGAGAKAATVCTHLTEPEATVELASCPDWVWPNADGHGYYRSGLTAGQWRALIEGGWKALTVRERLAAAGDLLAAIQAGDVGIDVALGLVPRLVAERERPFLSVAVNVIESVRPWVPAADRPRFGRWVRRQLGGAVRAERFVSRPTDTLDAQRIRQDVVPLVAVVGEDAALRKRAVAAVPTWRTRGDDLRGMILWIAVRARPELHDGLIAQFRAERDRVLRGDLARALGAVPDPARLEAALALLLDESVDIRDSQGILAVALSREDTQPIAAAWAIAHLDALIARVPAQTVAGLVGVFAGGCDDSGAAALRELAVAKLGHAPGAKRRIDQAFERLAQCSARRAANAPALAAWLKTLR